MSVVGCSSSGGGAPDECIASGSAALKTCAGGSTIKGVDVSTYQGNVSWAQVKTTTFGPRPEVGACFALATWPLASMPPVSSRTDPAMASKRREGESPRQDINVWDDGIEWGIIAFRSENK